MKKIYAFFIYMLFMAGATAQEQFACYFAFDKDKADEASGRRLANWAAANKGAEILNIYGYTDSIGSAPYNTDLSLRRAKHVQRQLAANKSISLSQELEVKGFGETNAFSANKSTDRVVIIYYKPATSNLSEGIGDAKTGDKLLLRGLNFYNDSDVILPGSRTVLKDLLEIMKKDPQLKIDIQGHICCQAIEEDNISLRRAKTVYNFLIQNDIEPDRLTYKGFGSSRPVYNLPEKSEEEKVANRRVEIQIISR